MWCFQVSIGPSSLRPRKVCCWWNGTSSSLTRIDGRAGIFFNVKHIPALFCALIERPHLVAHVSRLSTAFCSNHSASSMVAALLDIDISSAYMRRVVPGEDGASCSRILNRRGLRTAPCGTPLWIEKGWDSMAPGATENVRFLR